MYSGGSVGATRLTQTALPEEVFLFSDLKEKLHSLNRGDGCFGDGSGDSASQEVLSE